MKSRKNNSPLALVAGIALSATLQAAPVIYEPFDDTNASLTANTPGTGLSGTWAGSSSVLGTSLIFGKLPAGSGGMVSSNNQNGYVSVGSTLSDANLLDDGAELWFSVIIQSGSDVGTNGDLGFVLGTDQINSGNNIPISNSGKALGVRLKNNQMRAAFWSPTLLVSTGTSAPNNTQFLIVGKFTWGATEDKVEIFNAAPDFTLTAASTYTTLVNVDQSLFDTISFASKAASPTHRIDEFRFGATQADVLPVDTVAPTLLSTANNKGAGPLGEDVVVVTYTLTFDKHMDIASITDADFVNAGSATATIGTVTQVSPTEISVELLPTTTGTIQLRIPSGSDLRSLANVALDTATDIDDTAITINAGATPGAPGDRWWDGPITTGTTDGVSQGGAGTWDNGTTTSWDRGPGFANPVAWDNTFNNNAIFGGSANAAYSVAVSDSINLGDLTFSTTGTAGPRYTIDASTLNFAPGSTIRTADNRYDQTITSVITGSPAVNIKDYRSDGANDTYKGIIFAPASGTQTLGAILNPDNTGNKDKAGVTFAGLTTGNTVASINYAGGDKYANTNFQGGEWTVAGNLRTGTVRLSGGTAILNGTVDADYSNFVFTGGTLAGTGNIKESVTVPATGSLSPGASTGTLSITGTLNISAPADGGAGKLNFELGPIAASDKIAVTGTLNIGTGVLDFSDFDFTALTGLENGTYTLISSTVAVSGTLAGSGLSGTIGAGPATGTLQISGGGTDIELVVSGVGGGTSPYDTWANGTFANGTLTDKTATGDDDSDLLTNLREFAFGTDPTVSFTGPMAYVAGGDVTTPGQPVLLEEGGTYYAVFGRRKDHVAAGLTYKVQFSADLTSEWVDSTDTPTLVTGDPSAGDIEAVRVPFPGLIATDSGPLKATFFRVEVSLAP